MADQAWKEYFAANDMNKKAFDDSEVFQNYAKEELRREAERVQSEIKREAEDSAQIASLLGQLKTALEKKPELLKAFQDAKRALKNNPELVKRTDPNFVKGINLLDLGE